MLCADREAKQEDDTGCTRHRNDRKDERPGCLFFVFRFEPMCLFLNQTSVIFLELLLEVIECLRLQLLLLAVITYESRYVGEVLRLLSVLTE